MNTDVVITVASVVILFGMIFNALLAILVKKKNQTSYCLIFMRYPPKTWPVRVFLYLFPTIDVAFSSLSLLSLCAIVIERYTSTSSSKRNRWKNQRLIKKGVWGYSLLIFLLSSVRMITDCSPLYNKILFGFSAFVIYIAIFLTVYIEILAIQLCYKSHLHVFQNNLQYFIKSKSKFTCYTKFTLHYIAPSPSLLIWIVFISVQMHELSTGKTITNKALNYCMVLLPWVASAINPFIYTIIVWYESPGKLSLFKRSITSRQSESIVIEHNL